MLTEADDELILVLAGCTLARVPGKQNWLEEDAVKGLPEYICRIARAVHRGGKHSISESIAIAVGRAKTWARGGGGVTAKTSAKAAKAVAEWESKKKAAKLDNKVKTSNSSELATELTDAQLEMATLIPCTEKTNRSLLENVRLAHELKAEQLALLSAINDKPHLLELANRQFSKKARDKAADKGTALADGSYPIPDKDALRRAISSFGRAKPEDRARVKAHIKKRARVLGAMDMLPEGW